VAGARHDPYASIGEQLGHAMRGRDVALVVLARHQEDAAAQLVQAIPDRRRGALARAAEKLRE
jgi:hypothetical protein